MVNELKLLYKKNPKLAIQAAKVLGYNIVNAVYDIQLNLTTPLHEEDQAKRTRIEKEITRKVGPVFFDWYDPVTLYLRFEDAVNLRQIEQKLRHTPAVDNILQSVESSVHKSTASASKLQAEIELAVKKSEELKTALDAVIQTIKPLASKLDATPIIKELHKDTIQARKTVNDAIWPIKTKVKKLQAEE